MCAGGSIARATGILAAVGQEPVHDSYYGLPIYGQALVPFFVLAPVPPLFRTEIVDGCCYLVPDGLL